MNFSAFITTVWGGFGKSAELVIKVLGQRLAVREDMSNSGAMTAVRRRLQAAVMKQIAINGLAYLRRIRAQTTTA